MLLPLLLLSLLLPLSLSQKISLKVNLGGGPLGDFLGEDQVLDMSSFSKNVARDAIQNTDTPAVFQSQRFSRGTDFTMRIPVPDGIYSLTLLFAETFRPACVPGARVFDISLGTPAAGVRKLIDRFDVFQSAGCASAHGKRFDNVPSKQGIVVHLTQIAQHPSLAGFIVEGFPQDKGDGQHFKAIARAPLDPMLAGAPMDSAPQGMSMGMPAASYQGAAAQHPGMDMGQPPMGGAGAPAGGSNPFRRRRRLLAVPDTNREEDVLAEFRDIPPASAAKRNPKYSRGLKAVAAPVHGDHTLVKTHPDLDFGLEN